MPFLFVAVGLAVVIAIAAGHKKTPPKKLPQAPPEADAPQAGGDTVELDHGMPEPVVRQVLDALASETVPAHLEALAAGLHGHYPLTILALHARADVLRAHGGAPSATAAPHAGHTPQSSPAPQATPAQPAAGHPSPDRDLHAAAVLQAAIRAAVEEPDPVVLDGFAQSIRGPYPAAAAALEQRAQALRAAAHAPPAMAAPTPAPAPPPAAVVAAAAGPAGPVGGVQPGAAGGGS